jgi:hypothetical protein
MTRVMLDQSVAPMLPFTMCGHIRPIRGGTSAVVGAHVAPRIARGPHAFLG